ncbi:sensor domain-containing diguanylate cyclase [Simiduia aestuariiviva]|uniref:diguanylate cyclase n=1 Tax=Simiduia aestuariiviva TaxID=1510459 RepID=A0A839UNL0_9GAMM|nr:sensor domain-containing diguanylate cyclase [Simiduia aestuariiviva]MBB3168331.1 diguanylate cyclase (GGDEF)-like protein [Simiduia aestuariiviva]
MATLLVLSAFVLEVVLNRWYIKEALDEQKRIINITLTSINRIGASADEMALIAQQIGLVRVEHRITITNLSGDILGDSHIDEGKVESSPNLGSRPEMSMALREDFGYFEGPDELSGTEMLFLAKRFQAENSTGIVRVATSKTALLNAIDQLRLLLTGISIVVLVFLIALLATFKRHLSSAVREEKRLLESRVRSRTQQIALLQRLVSLLAACNTIDEIQAVIADIVPRILGNTPGAISLINASRNLVEIKATWQGAWQGEMVYPLEDCWALRKGKFHLSHDELSSMVCPHMANSTQNCVCIPLAAYGETLGLLHITAEQISEGTNNIAFTVAEHLGLALANLNMQRKLREQATRDPLTGLYNRRYMEEFMAKELKLGQRHEIGFGVLMIDVDHFKRFNDTFGHDAGDYVLATIADLVMRNIRGEDLAFRMGGEELAILLPLADIAQTMQCGQKLRELVKTYHWVFKGLSLGKVTMSIGAAVFPDHGQTGEQIIKAADVALYQAKASGRDTCLSAEMLAENPPQVKVIREFKNVD